MYNGGETCDWFLEYLNTLRPTIMESEVNESLPFLDTLLTRREDGKLDVSVYRKPTNTNRYLHYSSHHPTYVKRGVASCLFHCARTVAVGGNIRNEEELLIKVLRSSGYPDHVITAAAKGRKIRQDKEQPKYKIILPYVGGVSEDLSRVCKKYKIRTIFTTITTLRQQLTRVKDFESFMRRSGVVYKIPCSCGMEYIGETKRCLGIRMREHQAATKRGETEKSAIAEHAWLNQHRFLWDETSILDQARSNISLVIKEAFHIMLAEGRLLNRHQGIYIADCWRPLLRRVHVPRGLCLQDSRSSSGHISPNTPT